MKTAGQILKEARLAKKMDLADVSRITKIRSDSLLLIEADNYRKLPSGAVAKGFIRNYAEFLGVNPEQIQAIFRRDFLENEHGQIVPRGISKPVSESSLWTPRTTVLAAVVAVFIIFGGYLAYQYSLLVGPPQLKVEVTQENPTQITGTTDPEAAVTVNGQLISLEQGGHFFLRLPVTPGENTITIVATGKSGKTTTITRTVNLTPSP